MNNLIARITKTLSAILLIFGTLFAITFANTPSSYVYADENDTPYTQPEGDDTGDDETDPTDNNTPEGDDDPTNTPADDNNTDDPQFEEDTNTENSPNDNSQTNNNQNLNTETNTCQDQTGAIAWIVCPTTGVVARGIDFIYNIVDGLSVVPPVSMEANSPIYLVWQYARNITNIVFIIFLLIVIYSRLTGFGLNNYGIKRVLPRLIIAVILVNLSFVICALAVDLSNIIGSNLRGFFFSIQETVIANSEINEIANVPVGEIVTSIISGVGIAGIAIDAFVGFGGLFWMLIPVLIGAVIAVVSGLLTIAARQALVALLIMIAPLAFVAYLLPNTERWFTKWKTLFFQMLIFYPMFSLLFGASQLAGWALIASAKDGLGLVLGIAVQIFPLVFSWSLMKMSGTILSTLNVGIRKLAAPVQQGLAGWSLSHKELNRQRHLANSMMPGAKLRRYLDYRRELRELDTKNSITIRHSIAHERAMITASSSTGVDKDGNDTWQRRANRYTRNAKRAALYETRVGVADAAYRNTLSGYGRHFAGSAAARLSNAHTEAYLDTMKQQFLTANEAQADQDELLNRYIKAMNDSTTRPYQYNRLVKGAAGGLGYLGTSSIMGQVIQGNAAIEERRRKEARIMINKFGMEKHKQQFRAMEFDWARVSDDGFAYDKNGKRLEDDEYQIIVPPEILKDVPESERAKVAEEYRKKIREENRYPYYFGVHKTTRAEITKEEYDALSEEERKDYQKVKYLYLEDDKGNPVQTIFDTDAGYMKELIGDDIAISDPIIRRYINEIGVARNASERDGVLRKYHSTIRTNIDKEANKHGAGITALLTSAANAGYINNMSDYYYILAQSLAVAAKAGNFHVNDKFFIDEYHRLSQAVVNDELFDKLYQHDKIMGIVNNNGIPIDGMKLSTDENGNPFWEQIDYRELANMDVEQAIKYKKNFIKHGQLTKTLTSLVGFFGTQMSPEAAASLKPGAKPSMRKMLNTLKDIGENNLRTDIPFEQRLDGNKNIFSTPNGNDLYYDVIATQKQLAKDYDLDEDNQPTIPSSSNPGSSSGGNSSPAGRSGGNHSSGNQYPTSSSGRYNNTLAQLTREAEANRRYEEENDPARVVATIKGRFHDAKEFHHSFDLLCRDLLSDFEEITCLRPYYSECESAIRQIEGMPHPTHDNFINEITNPYEAFEKEQIEELYPEIMGLVNRALS